MEEIVAQITKTIKGRKIEEKIKGFFNISRMLASRVSLLHRTSFRHLEINNLTAWMTGF
jgi:hypothetical protein